jgi:hypothetical protein
LGRGRMNFDVLIDRVFYMPEDDVRSGLFAAVNDVVCNQSKAGKIVDLALRTASNPVGAVKLARSIAAIVGSGRRKTPRGRKPNVRCLPRRGKKTKTGKPYKARVKLRGSSMASIDAKFDHVRHLID